MKKDHKLQQALDCVADVRDAASSVEQQELARVALYALRRIATLKGE